MREVHGQFLKNAFNGNEPPLPPVKNEADKLRNWKLWKSTFGDVIVETYCHNIDSINWFMGGHPGKAYGTGGRTVETRGDIMDHLNVTFDYADAFLNPLFGSVSFGDTTSAHPAGAAWRSAVHVWQTPAFASELAAGRQVFVPLLLQDSGTLGLSPVPLGLGEIP